MMTLAAGFLCGTGEDCVIDDLEDAPAAEVVLTDCCAWTDDSDALLGSIARQEPADAGGVFVDAEGRVGVVCGACWAGCGGRSIVEAAFADVGVDPGRPGVLVEAAVSAIILLRSTLQYSLSIGWRVSAGRAHLSISTVRDFHTGPLELCEFAMSRGVIGLELFGV